MTAVHNRKAADENLLARPLRMQETIAEMLLEAMTFCVDSKVEETVRKWLTHADIAPDDPRSEERAAGGPWMTRLLFASPYCAWMRATPLFGPIVMAGLGGVWIEAVMIVKFGAGAQCAEFFIPQTATPQAGAQFRPTCTESRTDPAKMAPDTRKEEPRPQGPGFFSISSTAEAATLPRTINTWRRREPARRS